MTGGGIESVTGVKPVTIEFDFSNYITSFIIYSLLFPLYSLLLMLACAIITNKSTQTFFVDDRRINP